MSEALLGGETFLGERHEFRDELHAGDAFFLPIVDVETSGKCIDLIHKDFLRCIINEKFYSSDAGTAERSVGFFSEFAYLCRLYFGNRSRYFAVLSMHAASLFAT